MSPRWQAWTPYQDAPKINRSLVYLGACIIAGMRLAREKQVNCRVIPTIHAIEESIDLSLDVFTRVFRRATEIMAEDEVQR